jgi:metal-responsive CopG/Arc/MetJ family transcriptional regulator
MHMQRMKDKQITIRVPAQLARQVARLARERGVPKSHVMREALQAYLANTPRAASSIWTRVQGKVGTVSLDQAVIERDALAAQVRAHNWRE